jgi:hypothetical protein
LRPEAGTQPNAKKKCSVASLHSVSVVRQPTNSLNVAGSRSTLPALPAQPGADRGPSVQQAV